MRQTLLLLAAAVFIAALPCEAKPQAKRKPAPVPAQYDPLTEWELVNGAAMEARARLKKARKPEAIRQQIADLALRSAVGAERALALGDASLFDSYRRQFREQFNDTHWRLGRMARQGGGGAAGPRLPPSHPPAGRLRPGAAHRGGRRRPALGAEQCRRTL